MPAPVSASPPSRRRPTSTLGVSDRRPPPSVKPREPSSAVRTRVTPASDAFSRPVGPSSISLAAPTHSASDLERQREPAGGSRVDQLARVPTADIIIDTPVSNADRLSGVRPSAPVP